jgi:hypothetical protein
MNKVHPIFRLVAGLLAVISFVVAFGVWKYELASKFVFDHSGKAMVAMIGFGIFLTVVALRGRPSR